MQRHKLSIVCGLFLLVSTLAPAKIVFKSKRDGSNDIYVMNDDGSQVHRLTNDPFYKARVMWSSDGRQITFARDLHSGGAGKGQQTDVFIMNADGSNQRNLTQHPALDTKPSLSPDGRRLVFSSSRSGRWEIHVMAVSSGRVEQLTDSSKGDGYAVSPSWSPDGKHIVYALPLRGKGRDIYIMDADGKNAKPLINRAQPLILGKTIMRDLPRWSPDSQQIMYTELEYDSGPGRFKLVSTKLVICRRDGFNPQKLPIRKEWQIHSGCWAAGGTQIFFSAIANGMVKAGGNYEIYQYNRASRQITNLTNHPGNDYFPDWLSNNLSVSPAGKLSIQWGAIKRAKSPE